MPVVDVVMSVFNAGKYLSDTLIGLQRQSLKDFSIIVIDDGSTDDTAAVVRRAQVDDSRIRYWRQDNAGIVSAVNRGVSLATSSLIARHDADDISYPTRLEKQVRYLLQHADCVAVSALANHIDEYGRRIGTQTRATDFSAVDAAAIPAIEPYLLQPLMMMRRSSFQEVGGYRNLTVSEDTDLFWRLINIGRLHVIPELLGEYRKHNSSISSSSIENGRRMAAWSQLSAISARRIQQGIPDLEFSEHLKSLINDNKSLSGIYSALYAVLTEDERSWFHLSVSAKLLQLCYDRPFEPEKADIDFILSASRRDRLIETPTSHKHFKEARLSAGVRLIIASRINDALALVPSGEWPMMIGRVIFRQCLPYTLRTYIRSHKTESAS